MTLHVGCIVVCSFLVRSIMQSGSKSPSLTLSFMTKTLLNFMLMVMIEPPNSKVILTYTRLLHYESTSYQKYLSYKTYHTLTSYQKHTPTQLLKPQKTCSHQVVGMPHVFDHVMSLSIQPYQQCIRWTRDSYLTVLEINVQKLNCLSKYLLL